MAESRKDQYGKIRRRRDQSHAHSSSSIRRFLLAGAVVFRNEAPEPGLQSQNQPVRISFPDAHGDFGQQLYHPAMQSVFGQDT